MVRSLPAAAAFLILLIPSVSHAGKVKVWNHHAASDYEKARFEHAVVNSEGATRRARSRFCTKRPTPTSGR
jgi:hypothetical protein